MRYAATIAKTTLAVLIALGGTAQAQEVTKYKDEQVVATYLIQGNCTLTTLMLTATEFKDKTAGQPTSSYQVLGIVGVYQNTCTGDYKQLLGEAGDDAEVNSINVNGNLSKGQIVATGVELCDGTDYSFCVTGDINVQLLGTGAISEIIEKDVHYQGRAAVAGSPTSFVVTSSRGDSFFSIGQNILSNATLTEGYISRLKI